MSPRRRRSISRWTSAALVIAAVMTMTPFLLVVLVSFTSPAQFAREGLSLPDPWTLQNMADLLRDPTRLLEPMATTAVAAAVIVVVQTASSILAAYAFARFHFAGRRVLFWLYIGSYLVPPVVTFLPIYLVFVRVGLSGTYLALILPFAFASPYAIFLLYQWFAAIPDALFDAAELDGAGPWASLTKIALPLARPAVASVALVIAITTWNSYLWPRLIAGVQLPQVQVAIAGLRTQYDSNWTLIMAATLLTLLPPIGVTLLLRRPFLSTIDPQTGST